ncbi:LysR family transcriptional regulator [Skermania sp. ID1734]|uniref:LysR family transcriptional regulator n=1 Tax=Skermania sp. ID1734 TaxID=2597516 RepID=UPI00117DB271|nr:LysR family transcriptional regulator [Skermania sp. ID1734]TSD95650.1 LysR family transcriptional regulator [Skermania sp. ID1734]
MELHQLEYFLAVVEEANFTRAAERLHVAQPGVSAQIKRLERELGQALLDRSSRFVRPTAVGEAVLPHVKQALAAVEAVRTTADEYAGLVRGRLNIGMLSSATAGDVDLPQLLADFHRHHPDVEITLAEDTAANLLDSVRTGRADLAFTAIGEPPKDLATAVVRTERLVAAVGVEDLTVRRKTIRLTDLVQHRLISLPRGSGLRTILDDACSRVGLRPVIGYEAGNPLVACQLAAAGLGIAVVPESAVIIEPTLRSARIVEPALVGSVVLVWRSSGTTSPAARAFIVSARAAIDESIRRDESTAVPPTRRR